jgi:hypothetical protein
MVHGHRGKGFIAVRGLEHLGDLRKLRGERAQTTANQRMIIGDEKAHR